MSAIRLWNIGKKFKSKGKTIWAVRGVELDVKVGEIFGLLGPNGSGKTTLINIILTLLIPDEGEVRIFGKNPFVHEQVLQELNFVPANRPFPNLKVSEFLSCYARFYSTPREKLHSLMRRLRLERLAQAACWTLSTGEMTCLMIAKALLNSPKLLLLDEPAQGLDPSAKRAVEDILMDLNSEDMTIFFATHDVQEAERLATRIAFMKDGRILSIEDKEKVVERFGSVEEYWLRMGR